MKERKAFILPAFLAIILAFVLLVVMTYVQPGLVTLAEQTNALFGIGEQVAGADAGSPIWNFIYSFTDFGEGAFFTDTIGTLFMFAFGILSVYLENSKSKVAGTGVSGIGNNWFWLIGCQALGIVLANVIWKQLVGWEGWIPTFTPLVSVAPIAILCFGKPNFKKLLTGAILAALLPVPAVQLLLLHFSAPLGLPGFAAIGIGMSLSTVVGTEIFRLLPWMNKDDPTPADEAEKAPAAPAPKKTSANLVFERVFGGDISELYFWGSNWSGFGLFLGVLVSFLLNPLHANFGAGNVPQFIFMDIFTSAVAMMIWGPRFHKVGYAFTFEAVLVVCALVGAFPSWSLIIPTAIVMAFVAPAVIHWSMGHIKLLSRYAACVPVQFFASVLVIIAAYVLRQFA